MEEQLIYKDLTELRGIAKENSIKNTARKTEQTLIKDLQEIGITVYQGAAVQDITAENDKDKKELIYNEIEEVIPAASGGSTPGNPKPMHELIKEAQEANFHSEAAKFAEKALILARAKQRESQNKKTVRTIFNNK